MTISTRGGRGSRGARPSKLKIRLVNHAGGYSPVPRWGNMMEAVGLKIRTPVTAKARNRDTPITRNYVLLLAILFFINYLARKASEKAYSNREHADRP